LLIETPHVNLTSFFLSLITSTALAEESWEIWYLHLIFSSKARSLSIIILSAISGIPDKPSLVYIMPELIMPFFARW
jgi:ABC-type multidrug transport system permease subunit